MNEHELRLMQSQLEMMHTAFTAFMKKTELEIKELKSDIAQMRQVQIILMYENLIKNNPEMKEKLDNIVKGASSDSSDKNMSEKDIEEIVKQFSEKSENK
ncbi:hypothetical protein [Ruminococcus sp.]|uniref:hypothetical protein n=1 Tax=Ruminococcus sp. TaxID=41978 RepID=UPI001B5B5708|nr:hypothetical protein [Ruminococcus sp.]MBP5433610.1 hypothetical protein [Ruminococcus sp.]